MAYENVEKVSSDVFRPCRGFILRHTVQVATRNKEGNRDYCHSEFTYMSNKYLDMKYLKSVRLRFNSYLSLEEIGKDWTEKEFVKIDQANIHYFIKTLKRVKKWFKKKKYDNLFVYTDETRQELMVTLDFKDLNETVWLGQKVIKFTPAVIHQDDGCYEGVMMCVGTSESFGYISFDYLEAMYRIVKNFDLHAAGMAAVNYIGIPEEGKYNVDMESEHTMKKNRSFIESKGNLNSLSKEEPDPKLRGFFTNI